jgi:phage gp36-like protein
MAYCTESDLEALIGVVPLDQISDVNNTGARNAAVITAAIVWACTQIDAHANKHVLVPIPPPIPPLAKQLAMRLAIYSMRESKNMVDPDTHGRARESDEKILKAIQEGTITLGLDPPPPRATARLDSVSPRSDLMPRSRKNLRGFS